MLCCGKSFHSLAWLWHSWRSSRSSLPTRNSPGTELDKIFQGSSQTYGLKILLLLHSCTVGIWLTAENTWEAPHKTYSNKNYLDSKEKETLWASVKKTNNSIGKEKNRSSSGHLGNTLYIRNTNKTFKILEKEKVNQDWSSQTLCQKQRLLDPFITDQEFFINIFQDIVWRIREQTFKTTRIAGLTLVDEAHSEHRRVGVCVCRVNITWQLERKQ